MKPTGAKMESIEYFSHRMAFIGMIKYGVNSLKPKGKPLINRGMFKHLL